MKGGGGLSYVAEEVRRHDGDRFLLSLFAPEGRREDLLALAAFNLEIAKTREVVSEPMLGQIRLQWWRDAVAGLYEGVPPHHQVLGPLAAAVARHGLTREHLERLIDAREEDLEEGAPPDLGALESYAEAVAAPLIHLSLEVLGIRDGPAHEAARPLGTAWAMIGLLRALPFHARERRVYLPTAVVEEVAADMGELFELRPHAGAARAVERLAAAAEAHLRAARALRRHVPRAAVPALLEAPLLDLHLRALRRARFNAFDPRVQMRHPLAAPRLAWFSLRSRY